MEFPAADLDKKMLDGSFRKLCKEMAKKGMVAQVDGGMVRWIPFEKSKFKSRVMANTGGRYERSRNMKPGSVHEVVGRYPDGTVAPMEDVLREGLPAPQKRTPEERMESIVQRVIGTAQRTGTMPGFSDKDIKRITGIAHETGHTEVTVEMVRRLVANALREAERQTDVLKQNIKTSEV